MALVHGAAAVILVDGGLTILLQSGDECLAMFTNSAAQPSTVGKHGMVFAMVLWDRSSSSISNNKI